MSGLNGTTTRVFISYSWDSDEHRKRVQDLAQKLRKEGVDCWIDAFTQAAPEGWPRWMENEIEKAAFVVVVATKKYAERFSGKTPSGTGLGVNWEGSIITQDLYDSGGISSKLVSVFFEKTDVEFIPKVIRKFNRYDLESEQGYDALYRLLTNQPAVVPVEIGKERDLSAASATIKLAALDALPVYHHAARHSNLPRLPFGFFGRREELKTIAEALAPGARTWGALIDGPGGMGKTSLAIRAAELTPPGQFERIIFVTAKKTELTPGGARAMTDFCMPDYLTMLNEVAREMGIKDFAKTPVAGRPLELQTALQNARVMLIFDNLETLTEEDREKLNGFLNRLPGDCKAIITSRRRQEAYASIVRLGSLEEDAAFGLLTELAKANKLLTNTTAEQRQSLFVNTGGNPLLIRWVAGQLGKGGCKTMADALKLLHTASTKDDPLEFVFGDLAVDFTPNETKVLAALSHFKSPIEIKFIARLAELDEASTQGALDSLTNRALINSDEESTRYVIIPLVPDFLRRARPEVVKQTGDMLCGWAGLMAKENGSENHARFPNLEAEWPQIAAAFPLLAAGSNDQLQHICDALYGFLGFSGRWDERLSLLRLAEEKAVAEKDVNRAGWRAINLGTVYFRLGLSSELQSCAKRVQEYWKAASDDAEKQAYIFRLLGSSQILERQYPAAVEPYTKSLELIRKISPQSLELLTGLTILADAYRFSENYVEAEKFHLEALDIARQINHEEGIATGTGGLAIFALDTKDWPKAEKLSSEALSMAEKLNRKEIIAQNCSVLAKALVRQDRKTEALPYALRGVNIFTQLQHSNLAWAQEILKECQS